jgi:hypothetical protein
MQELISIIHDQLPPNVESEIMNLAEILKEEGKHEGKLETAKNMLLAGSDPVFVIKVTGLSLQEVKVLKKQIESE